MRMKSSKQYSCNADENVFLFSKNGQTLPGGAGEMLPTSIKEAYM